MPYSVNLADLSRWWRLEYSRVAPGGAFERALFNPTPASPSTRPRRFDPLPPEAAWVRYDPIVLPDGSFAVDVYAGHWLDGRGARRLKLVVDTRPLQAGARTAWRLTKLCLLQVPVRPVQASPSTDDVVFAGTFRLFPSLWENPFRTAYVFSNAYPADWYLPFWSIYHKRDRHGLFFMMDDHETDPNNGPHGGRGFAPAAMSANSTIDKDTIHLLFCQLPPTDYAPPGVPAPLPPFVQSGTLAVLPLQEAMPGFQDWYDIVLLYRTFVRDMPVVADRRERGIPERFRDVALAVAPVPPWTGIHVSSGELTEACRQGLLRFLESFPPGITPLVHFQCAWGRQDRWCPTCGDCADGGQDPGRIHLHSLRTNEQHEAYVSLLEAARDTSLPPARQRFFDQEIPLESLIHRFDSSAQVHPAPPHPAPRNPRLHRMVYGPLTRYSQPMVLHGYLPVAGFYPIYDLHALQALAEDSMPVLFVRDSNGSIFTDTDNNRVTLDLIHAYLRNYRSHLREIFSGDLIPIPPFDPQYPPRCDFECIITVAYIGGASYTTWIDRRDLLVHGAAYSKAGTLSLVLVNWGHSCPIGSFLCPPRNTKSEGIHYYWPVPSRTCWVRTTVARLTPPESPAFAKEQRVRLPLDSSVLRLVPGLPYALDLAILSPTGGPPSYRDIRAVLGGQRGPIITSFVGAQHMEFALPSPSLSILTIYRIDV